MGPIVKLVVTSVGIAAEYSQHRKAQKQLRRERDTLQAQEVAVAGPSRPRPANPPISNSPPTYDDAVAASSSREILAAGSPALNDHKSDDDHESDDNHRSDDDDDSTLGDDEAIWELDEAQLSDEPPSYEQSQSRPIDQDDLVGEVLQANVENSNRASTTKRQPLPMPVIIPQRRPGSKRRGFVRAYAPLLGECSGIDEATFLAFLKNFSISSKEHPAFTVVQVAADIAPSAPGVIALAVATALQAGAQVSAGIDRRRRTNNFLDQMNEKLFRPAGLFAMIFKYSKDIDDEKPGRLEISSRHIDISTNRAIAGHDLSSSQGTRSTRDRLRTASGHTHGAAMLPESCPLVFPDLDLELAQNSPEGFKDRTRDFGKFLSNYMDKRAQMKYAQDDPNSGLAMSEEQYAYRSKLADPNHPMYNGNLAGVVSGGYMTRDKSRDKSHSRIQDRRRDRRKRRHDRISGVIGLVEAAAGSTSNAAHGKQRAITPDHGTESQGLGELPYNGQHGDMPAGGESSDYHDYEYHDNTANSLPQSASYRSRRRQNKQRGLKKFIKEDILYLMIVNMPDEEELAQARRMLYSG